MLQGNVNVLWHTKPAPSVPCESVIAIFVQFEITINISIFLKLSDDGFIFI